MTRDSSRHWAGCVGAPRVCVCVRVFSARERSSSVLGHRPSTVDRRPSTVERRFSPARAFSSSSPEHARRGDERKMMNDDDRDDDMGAHRETLGFPARSRPSVDEVKRAFKLVAMRSHPDASSSGVEATACGKRFRAAVRARDALTRRARLGVDGRSGTFETMGRRTSSMSFRSASRVAGGAHAKTFAVVMATPFLVAGVVSVFALPRGTEERAREGEAARMGRVDGWMNPPRNEWLREDTREVGDGNARRFWKTGRVTAAARRAGA